MGNLDIEALQVEFDADPELQGQFGSFENYLSYKRAGAGGFISDPAGYLSFSVTNGNLAIETASEFDEGAGTDDQLKDRFAESEELRDEYGDVGSYLAYIHHQRAAQDREERLSERHRRKTFRAQRQELAAKS
jgi:hypothetical protein